MEISKEEYQELQQQIKDLQCKVDSIKKPIDEPVKKISLKSYIVDEPITGAYMDDKTGIAMYRRTPYPTWELFVKLAKSLVVDIPEHVERSSKHYGNKFGYFDTELKKGKDKLISNFNDEEFKHAVDMLNEISIIYNKHYKSLHPTVMVKFANSNESIPVEIKDIG